MGNNGCCQTSQDNKYSINQNSTQVEKLPPLKPQLQSIINSKMPLQGKFEDQKQDSVKRYFRGDIYHGPIDLYGRPEGVGKMYKEDSSYFIGYFQSGVAQGEGFFLMPNGAYYEGTIANNKAEASKGVYESPEISYRGGFSNNKFQNEGKEIGKGYKFQGKYENGKKKEGTLLWNVVDGRFENEYRGTFNEREQFHGKGQLSNKEGRYVGEFSNGKKHGEGAFTYQNGKKYSGKYVNGIRQGTGQLYSETGELEHAGDFRMGVPLDQNDSRASELMDFE